MCVRGPTAQQGMVKNPHLHEGLVWGYVSTENACHYGQQSREHVWTAAGAWLLLKRLRTAYTSADLALAAEADL